MGVYTVNQTDGSLQRVAGGTFYADAPIGAIQSYGGETAPAGWLMCDGSAVSRTEYAELFAVIGIAFGVGDGETTFNLPDLREAVPKGAGLTGKTVGNHVKTNGLAVGEFIDDRFQNHSHMINRTSGSSGAYYGIGVSSTNALNYAEGGGIMQVSDQRNFRYGDTTEVKSVGVNYIIKAKMVAVPFDVAEYIRNQNVLSEWESITIPTTEATAITMMYDGYISCGSDRDTELYLYVDGHIEARNVSRTQEYDYPNINGFPFKKGQSIYLVVIHGALFADMSRVAYYKLRDYSGR